MLKVILNHYNLNHCYLNHYNLNRSGIVVIRSKSGGGNIKIDGWLWDDSSPILWDDSNTIPLKENKTK